MYDLKGFGKRIEEARKNKNMTQENLAEKFGVTSQAVSKWENGACYPDIELIPTICALLEMSLDDIFGKVKNEIDNISFPPVYKGLNLTAAFANIACYSDKEIESADGPAVNFKDGSSAELSSRRVVNRGTGRIILRALDESFISEDNIKSGNFKKLTETKLNFEYGRVKKLECAIPNGNCEINKSNGEKTEIYTEGYPEFIDMLEFEYISGNETLKIGYDKFKRDKLNNAMNKWDISKNKIKIDLAFDGDMLENTGLSIDGAGNMKLNAPCADAGMSIHGSGNIEAPVSFLNLGANIHGSGNIAFVNADKCNLNIHGSGDFKFENAENCFASIHGSGEIKADKIINLAAKIHGSGDMDIYECDVMNIEIHGSGDFDTDKVNKSVAVVIQGSGDVNIESGEVETFEVHLNNGEVRAKGVTADRAKIEIPDNGTVEIGRVKIESVEKCGDKAEIIIHQRG